ncbi:unnamed protein product, partial [Iphiclides podalirius]
MRAITVILALSALTICKAVTPKLHFAWKEVDYKWDSPEQRETAISAKLFIPANNLPVGVGRWNNKMFITVPRWRYGVASSLNYIDLDGPVDQPLKPYPSLKDNLVPDTATALPSNSSIISVFRVFIDPCDRLWVMDTGKSGIFGPSNQIVGPSLVIFDLKTDELLHRYFFKKSDTKENSFFGNVVVDVDKNTCDNAFAYVADLGRYAVVVYSLKQDDSWRVEHHYFHLDPFGGSFNISGLEFQWSDGVLGLALSEPRENGYRTMFFHALCSTKEFSVSTEVLRNYRQFDRFEVFKKFKLLGDRGLNTQSTSSFYDESKHVLFYTQIARDGLGCWNSQKPYTPENNPLLFSDPELFEFPVDLKLDEEHTMWFLTDRLPRFFYTSLDPNVVNFRLFSINTTEAIEGTTCQ